MKNIIFGLLAMGLFSTALATDGGKTSHKNFSKKTANCCKKGSCCDKQTVCLPGCAK